MSRKEMQATFSEGNLSIPEKIKRVLSAPSGFFPAVKNESLQPAFVYYALLSLVYTIFVYVVNPGTYGRFFGGLGAVIGIPFWWIATLVLSFVFAGVIHIFVALLGGKNGFANTYKAFIYGGTPAFLFGWIPFIGILFSFWSLYLDVKGLSALQNMSTGRASAAIILPFIIITVLTIILAFLWFSNITRMVPLPAA